MSDLDELLASRRVALLETIASAQRLVDQVGDISGNVAAAQAARTGAETAAASVPAGATPADTVNQSATNRYVTPAGLGAVAVTDPNLTAFVPGWGEVTYGWFNQGLTKLAAFISGSGSFVADKAAVLRALSLGDDTLEPLETDYDFLIGDAAGNAGAGLRGGRWFTAWTGDLDLAVRSTANAVRSRGVSPTAIVPGIIKGDNVLLSYGQSLETGSEGWPGLTGAPVYTGVKACLPQANSEDSWPAATAYTDLVATNLDASTFTPGDGRGGEAPAIGMAYAIKELADAAAQVLPGDVDRRLIALRTGIGGRSLEQLSKVNTTDTVARYSRMLSAVDNAVTLSAGAARPISCPSILWIQGDSDYGTVNNSIADHKAKLKTLIADMRTDVIARTGQKRSPAFLMFQFSGRAVWNIDKAGADTFPIPIAQWQAAQETPGAYVIGPYYQVTDKGVSAAAKSHQDSNGYRWMGEYAAKVFDIVVVQRRGWRPLSPTRVTSFDRHVYIDYHVPVGPLQFRPYYRATTATMLPSYGFRVTDTAGDVPILSVSILNGNVVDLSLGRRPIGPAYVTYGDEAMQGGGNLCDSDPAVGRTLYEYQAGRGQYADANIPELVGKPYPLLNWSILGRWAVGYSEY